MWITVKSFMIGVLSAMSTIGNVQETETAVVLSANLTTVRPGAIITFQAAVTGAVEAVVLAFPSEELVDETPPYEWSVPLSSRASGSFEVFAYAAVRNSEGALTAKKSAPLKIVVIPDRNTLEQLTFVPADPLSLSSGMKRQMRVIGEFTDSINRNLTEHIVGTQYSENIVDGLKVTPGDSPAISVTQDGLVTALEPGIAEVVASNAGKTVVRRVKVVQGSEVRARDIIISPPNPTSDDMINITVSGKRNDSCAPRSIETTVLHNYKMIALRLVPEIAAGEICLPVITPWSVSSSVGVVPEGDYLVEVFRMTKDRGNVLASTVLTVEADVPPPPPVNP